MRTEAQPSGNCTNRSFHPPISVTMVTNKNWKNRACVIGAGAAGLVAAKECREAGLDVTVLERGQQDEVGGIWRYDKVSSL